MTKQTEALKLALRSIRELVLDESDDAPALQGARMRKQIAEKAIREALAEQPAQQEPVALPEGKKLILVDGSFDDLMYWLERCEDKGHLENCLDLVEPWENFSYEECTTPPAQQEPVASKLLKQEEEINSLRNDLRRAHDAYCQLTREPSPAKQEPVGEVSGHDWSTGILYRDLEPGAPLYTSPPAQRKPLADEAIRDCWSSVQGVTGVSPKIHAFARAIEAKLKEKNT